MAKKKQVTEAKQTEAVTIKEEKILPPAMVFSLSQLCEQLTVLEPLAMNLVIASKEQESDAISLGVKAKKIFDDAEVLRVGTVKPVNDAVAKVNAAFKFVTERAKTIIEASRKNILDFRASEKRKEDERVAKLQKSAKGRKELAAAPPSTPTKQKLSKDGTGCVKECWKFEVIDKKKIPMDYLIADEKSIGVAVRSGVRSIPGVKIFDAGNVAFK
jgi:hypothetical protein